MTTTPKALLPAPTVREADNNGNLPPGTLQATVEVPAAANLRSNDYLCVVTIDTNGTIRDVTPRHPIQQNEAGGAFAILLPTDVMNSLGRASYALYYVVERNGSRLIDSSQAYTLHTDDGIIRP